MRRTLILFSVIAWTSLIAHLRADSVTLAWDANTDLVSGYRIFAGQASRTYVLTNEIGPFLTGTFTNLANGIWYFSVTAHLDVGNNRLESGFSDEISWTNNPAPPAGLRIFPIWTNVVALDIRAGSDYFLVQRSGDLLLWEDALRGLDGFRDVTLTVDLSEPKRFYRMIP